MRGEELLLAFGCYGEPVAWAGEDGQIDEPVVLAEADKDRRQDPRHRRLGDPVIKPRLVGARGAVRLLRVLPFQAEGLVELGHVRAALTEVVFQQAQLRLQVAEQCGAVDHDALLASADGREGGRYNELFGVTGDDADSELIEPGREVQVLPHRAQQPQPVRGLPGLARRTCEPGKQLVAARVPGQWRGVVQEDHPVSRAYPVIQPPPCLLDQAAEADPGAGADGRRVRGEYGFPARLALRFHDRMERGDELRRNVDWRHSVKRQR